MQSSSRGGNCAIENVRQLNENGFIEGMDLLVFSVKPRPMKSKNASSYRGTTHAGIQMTRPPWLRANTIPVTGRMSTHDPFTLGGTKMHQFTLTTQIGAARRDRFLNVSELLARVPACFKSKTLKRSLWAVAAFAVLLLTIPALQAQTTASLSGTVTDPTGAVVPGASIVAINEATADKTNTVSGKEGNFTFPVLLPGTYTLSIQANGFENKREMGIVLTAGADVRVASAVLTVGSSAITVTVSSGEEQVLQSENGQVGAVLEAQDIDNLALVSRTTLELLKVLPGVISAPNNLGNGLGFDFLNAGTEGSPVGVGLATNGAPNRGGTGDLLDGVNVTDPGCNCWSIATILPDWTDQVSYQASNFGADVSHGPTIVNSISKGGTAKYHGSAYLYARNDVLNANSWLNNSQKQPEGGAKFYYPGGNFGGPIPFTHKKLLGWFGYEKFIQNLGGATTVSSHIPTSDMMSGNFGATTANSALCSAYLADNAGNANGTYCNNLAGSFLPDGTAIAGSQIPSQFISSNAAALAKIWPSANATPSKANGYANYFQVIPAIHDGYMWRARLDYNFSDRDKVYVSYQYGNDTQLAGGGGTHLWYVPGNSIPFPGSPMLQTETTKVLTGHFTHIFSDTLTNEMVGSVGYGNNPITVPDPAAVYKTTVGYNGGTVFNTGDKWMPSYNTPGGLSFPDFSTSDFFTGTNYPTLKEAPSAYDNVIKVAGKHTLKTGVFYELVNNHQASSNAPNGIYSFNGGPNPNVVTGNQTGSPQNPTANFVMGNATNYSENNYNPAQDLAYRTISFYGDDTFRITRRITAEYGVRFDHLGRWYDRGSSGVPVFNANNVLSDYSAGKQYPGLSSHATNPGLPKSGVNSTFLLFSPRFGLSYDIFGTGKTVVRGGWGVYRWGDQWNDFSSAVGEAQGVQNFNLAGSKTVLLNQVGTGAPGLTPPPHVVGADTGTFGGIVAVDPNDHSTPTTVSYNFTIDQQLPWKTALEIAYVGSQSSNVLIGGGNSAALNGTGAGSYLDVNKVPLGALFLADPKNGVVAQNPENVTKNPNGTLTGNNLADYQPYGYAYGTNGIAVLSHTGYTNYNGFQIAVVKRSEHVTFNVNYTRSKTLGTDLNENPFSLRANYGVEQIDRPNDINMSYTYNVKSLYRGSEKLIAGAINDWMISGITTWQGGGNLQAQDNPNFSMTLNYASINGAPVSATNPLPAGVNPGYGVATYYGTTAGSMTVQPALTCNPGSGLATHQHAKATCFTAPAIHAYGARNFPYLSGPSYTNADLSMAKTFHITENHAVTLRANVSNWLNHPLATFSGSNQLQLKYNTDYTSKAATLAGISSTYGVTDSKTGGDTRRIVELALKYQF